MSAPHKPAHGAFAPLTPDDIVQNPELALLVVLAHTLDAAADALLAAYPALGSEPFDDPAPPLWVAEAIISQTYALRRSLDTYRHAVERERASLCRRERRRDFPF